jgi:hypothetical protein
MLLKGTGCGNASPVSRHRSISCTAVAAARLHKHPKLSARLSFIRKTHPYTFTPGAYVKAATHTRLAATREAVAGGKQPCAGSPLGSSTFLLAFLSIPGSQLLQKEIN